MHHIKKGKAMRYDSEHKTKTRQKVLKEAAKAIRAEGPHQIAVAGVMAKAGLTHGGFYAHFASKDELVAAAIGEMFAQGRRNVAREMGELPPAAALAAYIDFYLSTSHRDSRTHGCPLPALAADLPRLPVASRRVFGDGVQGLKGALEAQLVKLGHPQAADEASSMLAEMVGAISLARAEPEAAASDAFLTRSRAALKRRFGLEGGA